MQAMHGMSNTKGTAHMETLTCIGQIFEPQHKQIIDSKPQRQLAKSNPDVKCPRLAIQPIKPEGVMYDPDSMLPMVRPTNTMDMPVKPLAKLIVKSESPL